jgi:hypothetical protein
MSIRINPGIMATANGDSASAATVGISPISTNSKIFVCGASLSFSDSTVATKAATIKDGGVTKVTIHVGGTTPRDITFNPPIEMHDSVDGSLPASGVSSAVGTINLLYFKA